MNEERFRSEMRRAQVMQETCNDPLMNEYWSGYIRGLRRSFHGENFGTPDEHEKWMGNVDLNNVNSAVALNEMYGQRTKGYRDALKFGEITSTMGPPTRFGAMLDKLPVKKEIKEALIARAAEIGESIPDTRRQALKEFLEKK